MQQASTLSLAMSSMVWKYLIRWRRFRQVTRCLASNFRDLYTDGSDVLLQSLCMQRVDWHWCAPRVMRDFHVQEHQTGRRRRSR